MRAYEQINLIAYRVPDVAGDQFGVAEGFERKLAGVERAHGHYGVELDGGEAHLHVLGGAFGSANRIAEYVADGEGVIIVALFWRRGIQVGVRAQFLVNLPAQQVVNGLVKHLAYYVPAGDFESAQDGDEGVVGMLGVAAGIDVAP